MILIPYCDASEVLIRSSEDPACSCGIAVVHGGISGLMSAVQFCGFNADAQEAVDEDVQADDKHRKD